MTERFILKKSIHLAHAGGRIPGQVPSKETIALMRTMQDVPPKFHPAMLLQQGGAYLSPVSVVSGLGLDKAQESSWIKFLETNLRADNGLLLRKAIMAKAQGEGLNPALRNAILERSLMAYRDMRKSMVDVVTPDELRKGEAKGGAYTKRVTLASGRHRYFYDDEKYKASKHAHISGEDASRTAIRSGIQKAVQTGGPKGCELKTLQPLVKRYGHKMVASVLDEDVKKNGKLRFKKGRLYSGSGVK